jgi:hypothetical protein
MVGIKMKKLGTPNFCNCQEKFSTPNFFLDSV